jgi:hypothetical protein
MELSDHKETILSKALLEVYNLGRDTQNVKDSCSASFIQGIWVVSNAIHSIPWRQTQMRCRGR